MNHTKRLLFLAAGAVGAIGFAAAGWAYWSAVGSGSASATVGTINPPANVVATATPGSGTVPVSWTPSSTGSLGVAPTGYYVQRYAGSVASAACGSSLTSLTASPSGCSDTGVPDGSYTYKVTAVFHSWTAGSAASNPVTVVNDNTPPTVSSLVRVGANPSNAGSVSWTVAFSEPVTGVDATDFSLAATGVSGGSITGVTGSGASYTVSASTGAGDGTLGLNLVDDDTIVDLASNKLGGAGAGNGNFTGQLYSIDKTAPTVISITRSGGNPTNAGSVSWTVTFSEAVTGADATDFALAASGVSGASITSASGSTFTVTATTGSGDGTLGLNLVDNDTIVDAAGNKLGGTGAGNGNFAGQGYTIDKTAPTVAIAKATAQADPTTALPINFTVTYSEPVTRFTSSGVTLGGMTSGTKTAVVTGSGSTYNVAVSGATGTGTVTAAVNANAAQDAAGNNNTAAPSSASVTYDTTPTVTTVSPVAGKAAGGTSVIVTGTGFLSATSVTFGGNTGTSLSIASDTSLTITSPAHTAGQVDILVTNPAGTSTALAADKYTYDTSPTVTAVSPVAGRAAGGTSVTVTGTGFLSATGVTFGGTAGTSLSIASDTSLTITSPPHAAGQVDVLVTNPAGTSSAAAADKYTYDNIPTVTGVSPAAGLDSGGTTVTVTGTGFFSATGVTFGGTAGTSLSIASDTSLTITSPPHAAGQVDVLVTNPAGTSSAAAADKYTYQPGAFSVDSGPNPQDGTPSNGDQIVYTFTDVMDPASIKTSWTGTSVPVTTNFGHCSGNASPDCLTVNSVNLGSVALQGSYVISGNHSYTASASMIMTTVNGRSVVTITLTSTPSSSVSTDVSAYQMVWTPSISAKNSAGTAVVATPVTQGTAKENF